MEECSPPPAGVSSHSPRGSPPSSVWTEAAKKRISSVTNYDLDLEVKEGVVLAAVPDDVFEDEIPLWKNFVLGHFIGDAPHVRTVHKTVNRIWQPTTKSLKIDVQFLTATAVLFRIDDDNTRSRVLNRQFWHIADIPMVVQEWSPESATMKPEITAIPMWVDFKGVPGHYFSYKGLSFLVSHVGHPVKLHPKTEKCLRLDVARILVKVNLQNPLPSVISLPASKYPAVQIPVSFPWLPPRCTCCEKWGHVAKDCVLPVAVSEDLPLQPGESVVVVNGEEVSNTTLPDASQEEDNGRVSQSNQNTEEMGVTQCKDSAEEGYAWTTVMNSGRRSPPTVATSTGLAVNERVSGCMNSPSSFQVLDGIREEGEIEEDDAIDGTEAAQTCSQEQGAGSNQPGTAQKGKTKEHKTKATRRQIVRTKDLKYANGQNASKRASDRKL